ncbi:MAG: phenylacetate--CoA ligase family protein [Anaerolineae bacterium]|nr:phenylacetate--CoA ligase family protein [Anaerolineae bacterium]
MSGILEALALRLPHPLRTLAATYKSHQLDRIRRHGDRAALQAQVDFAVYRQMSRAALDQEQARRLAALLDHARQHIPFYRETYAPTGWQGESALAVLAKLPLLSKPQVRAAGEALLDERHRKTPHYVGHTSGSTGSPLNFHWSYQTLRTRFAMRDAFYQWHGVDFDHECNIRIGGRLFAPVSQKRPPFWLYDRATRQLMFSIYHMSDTTLAHYTAPIQRWQPTFVTGYPSGIYTLARYCQESGFVFRPKAVFTDSETVLDHQRALMEAAWGCPVVDYLGMEGGWIAQQCRAGRYHTPLLTAVVEIVDEAGQPTAPGEIGEIVVTDLTNDLMPLLRYRTGDSASWSADGCECGWNTPVLQNIEGRLDDFVTLPNGRKVGRLDHIFKNASGIRECQIVQESPAHFVFRLVPSADYSEAVERRLRQEAHARLGQDIRIDIQQVPAIERTGRGKFRAVISKVS